MAQDIATYKERQILAIQYFTKRQWLQYFLLLTAESQCSDNVLNVFPRLLSKIKWLFETIVLVSKPKQLELIG